MTGRNAGRSILLFGLSANPPTGSGGHAGIVGWAASGRTFAALSNRAPAEVWVLPVYVHSFSQKRNMPAFPHRMAMARLAFARLPGASVPVRVLDVERRVAEAWAEGSAPGSRPGTVDVVRYLAAAHPGTRFGLLLGADTYLDLAAGRWKESEALRSLVDMVVVPRRGKGSPDALAADPPELSDISSSVLRATTDENTWRQAVCPEVFAYVREHGLYGFG